MKPQDPTLFPRWPNLRPLPELEALAVKLRQLVLGKVSICWHLENVYAAPGDQARVGLWLEQLPGDFNIDTFADEHDLKWDELKELIKMLRKG